MPRILDSLPALYRGLLPAFFEREIPTETKATCASCAMCETSCQSAVAPVDGRSRLFRPDTKCCTFYPRLPNYLVGALLSDDDPSMAEGRRRVEAKLAARIGATPQWLKPPAKFDLLYTSSRRAFGRSATLRCPYYDVGPGSCTIWRYREAVCSTFFCKYVAGADGRKLWMSIKTFLSLVEIQLSRHALFRLHPEYIHHNRSRGEAESSPLTVDQLDEEAPPEAEYRAMWREWTGREAEYYRACFDEVRELSAADLERFLGLDGTLEEAILDRLYGAAVSPELPEVLRFNPDATVQWLPDGSVALGAYSEYDAIGLPGEAYALLVEFTGQEPVSGVRRRLREQKQADLDEEVLLVLHRHRVLVSG
ncbi:hypothetical protein WME91_54880 [Sorangium sp. So ce269]